MHGFTHRPLCHRIVAIATCFALVTLPSSTAAHPPTPVHSMAFATVGEHTLYVKGGRTSEGRVVSQFFALELTVQSWDTANPPWKEFTDTTASDSNTTATAVFPSYQALSVSQENEALTVWTPGVFKVDYNIRNDTWTPISRAVAVSSRGSLSAHTGFQAVTDPTTGLVYISGGYKNDMLVYNPTDNKVTTVPMPQTLEFPHWTHYSFVWSQSTRSFFFFGGGKTPHGSSSSSRFWEYSPSTKSWISLQLSGSLPGPSTSSCLVAAHNGTKIILFGGRRGDALLGDLHILDVRTRIWTQERGVGPNDNRADMACSVAGDHFVVWGGTLPKAATLAGRTSGTPLIFNLWSKRWATRFLQERSVAMSALSKRGDSGSVVLAGAGIGGGIFIITFLCCCLTAHRWHQEEQNEMKLKALEGLQQKVPQYNTQNNEPIELVPWSADKMEIQSVPAGVAYGQTTYAAPTTVLTLGTPSSSQTSPPPFPQQASWPAQSPTTLPPSAPSNPLPTAVYSGSPESIKDLTLFQQQYLIQLAQPQHPHTHVVDAPSISSTSSSPKIVRSPQDRSEPAPYEESPQELARQIRVMQTELQRLQAKLDR